MDGDNIAVAVVNPGYFATRLTNLRFQDDMDEFIAGMMKGCVECWHELDQHFLGSARRDAPVVSCQARARGLGGVTYRG
jgi:hypothetical protein